MKLSVVSLLIGAAACLKLASATAVVSFVPSAHSDSESVEDNPLPALQKKAKHPSFAKVMEQVEKADKGYFRSGNFDPNCAESYDFLFYSHVSSKCDEQEDEEIKRFKFNFKAASHVLGYMIEAGEEELSWALVSKWIDSRKWKQHNREDISKDLTDLIEVLKGKPEILIPAFKMLVGAAAVEIVHEASWASIAASLIKVESKMENLNEASRNETVAFLIDHFFRVADEHQDELKAKVMKKLSKKFKEDDETGQLYLQSFAARFSTPTSPLRNSAMQPAQLQRRQSNLPAANMKRSASRTAPPSPSTPGATLHLKQQLHWYENNWIWIAFVAGSGIILLFSAFYCYSSKTNSVNL
jgi:hypothetical protein